MKKYYLGFLGILLSHSAMGLEVKEALEFAYKNNPTLKSFQQDYIGDLQEFPQALSQGFLPDISISTKENLSKQTPLQRFQGIRAGEPSKSEEFARNITLQQNIFAGGSSVFGLAAVKHKLDASKIKYISKEQEFLLKGILAYVGLIAAKDQLDVAKSFVNSAEKEYESANEKFKVGEATTTDVAQAKAQYSQALAQNAGSNAGYLAAKSNFKSYFGIEADDTIKVPEVPADLPDNYDTYRSKALATNLNIRSVNAQLKSSKNSLKASSGKLLPTVTAQAQASSGFSGSPNIGNSKSGTRSYSTTLSVNIPILSQGGAEYSKIRAAKAQYRQATYLVDQTNHNIDTQLIQNWEGFIATKLQVEFTEEAVSAYKLVYEGTKSQYAVGVATLLDVLKAEKEMYNAINQSISAKQKYIEAAYTIKSDLAQLTAKDMGLNVKLFDPEAEFRKTKFKIVGF